MTSDSPQIRSRDGFDNRPARTTAENQRRKAENEFANDSDAIGATLKETRRRRRRRATRDADSVSGN
jgi:hypothetical protein